MNDIVERIKDAENATHALFNHIFQDAREEIERLRAKIAQMERQEPSVPDGWKLVPIEPTAEIRKAMHYAYWQSPQLPYHDGSPELWNAAYAAMLAAAPEAKP